jgi:protein phosphatase
VAPVVDLCAATDVGLVRTDNQDSHQVGDLESGELAADGRIHRCEVTGRGPLLVVCDGMGGAVGGEVASRLAAEVVWAEMRAAEATADRAVYGRVLRRAVRLANRRVFEEAQRHPHLHGMGTTLSAAGVVGDSMILAQVGDSRAYIHRGTTLTQVTRDQSIVSALVHAGRITPEEARRSVSSNMILQALGVREDLEVSLSIAEIRDGDAVLLCSDGLHALVDHELLAATLTACGVEIDESVRTLVALARKAGGGDNITAVVGRFSGPPLRSPRSPEDLPRFVEFNPMEEGAHALTTTSWVARRLAARAGIGDDPGPPVVPATGQHPVFRGEIPEVSSSDELPPFQGPATRRLAERERLGLVAWVVAVVAVLAIGVILLWDRLSG